MKKMLIAITMILMSAAVTQAGVVPSILPTTLDTHYYGAHDFSFNLGAEGMLIGRLEFAVYTDSQADDMIQWTEYQGDADYVYAYQVFCDQSSTAALTYFALTGIDPTTIADVQDDIGETESLNGNPSGGEQPASSDFNDTATKAIWQFDAGTLIQGEQSWFLFLYSDYDWIGGDIQVKAVSKDDIPIPGIPEPATLVLLIGGTVLSFKRRK